eukprot:GHUV01031982.1.p1 GENE.GHUV01031982.1~~GHUV01031982.1.p1  ORF type:complete len:117 (-),score=13.58 GHUV01031982.1:254-604(-)
MSLTSEAACARQQQKLVCRPYTRGPTLQSIGAAVPSVTAYKLQSWLSRDSCVHPAVYIQLGPLNWLSRLSLLSAVHMTHRSVLGIYQQLHDYPISTFCTPRCTKTPMKEGLPTLYT